MMSKFSLLSLVLGVLFGVRYIADTWVKPALTSPATLQATHQNTVASSILDGLISALNGFHFMLGLCMLSCAILLARSFTELLSKRGASARRSA